MLVYPISVTVKSNFAPVLCFEISLDITILVFALNLPFVPQVFTEAYVKAWQNPTGSLLEYAIPVTG